MDITDEPVLIQVRTEAGCFKDNRDNRTCDYTKGLFLVQGKDYSDHLQLVCCNDHTMDMRERGEVEWVKSYRALFPGQDDATSRLPTLRISGVTVVNTGA